MKAKWQTVSLNLEFWWQEIGIPIWYLLFSLNGKKRVRWRQEQRFEKEKSNRGKAVLMMSTVLILSILWLKAYYGFEMILSRSTELSQRNVLLSTITMLVCFYYLEVIEPIVHRPLLVHLAPRRGQMSGNAPDPAVFGGGTEEDSLLWGTRVGVLLLVTQNASER